MIIRVQ